MRLLKEDNFLVSSELESLHCLHLEHVLSFSAMWAYGAHYSTNNEITLNTIAFDSGIVAIPPSPTYTNINVGILKSIILVTYLNFNVVLMEGTWIKSSSEGRCVIKKDSYGFWTVQYLYRAVREKDNPYVYLCNVSQVFFI